jgi:HEAT repeat protein
MESPEYHGRELKGKEPDVCREVIDHVLNLTTKAFNRTPGAFEELVQTGLKNHNRFIAAYAARTVTSHAWKDAQVAKRFLEPIAEHCLKKKHGHLSRSAAIAIAGIGGREAESMLIRYGLSHENPGTVKVSAESLGDAYSREALPKLRELESHSDEGVKEAARDAIERIEERHRGVGGALFRLRKRLTGGMM